MLLEGITRDAKPEQFCSMIGYLPQDVNFYDDFTAVEYLQYVAALKGLPDKKAGHKIEELADKVGLTADVIVLRNTCEQSRRTSLYFSRLPSSMK